MTFKKTVLAYLTGWVIAQATYNRLMAESRKKYEDEYIEKLATAVAEKLNLTQGISKDGKN